MTNPRNLTLCAVLVCVAGLHAQVKDRKEDQVGIASPSQPPLVSPNFKQPLQEPTETATPRNIVVSDRGIETRIDLLENERTWVIGLTAGLGIGIAVVVWLRRDIVRTLVQEAFPSETLWDQNRLKTWRPNGHQWWVIWIATVIATPLFIFLPRDASLTLRILIAIVANATLLLFRFSKP